MRTTKVLAGMRFLPPGLVSTFAIHFQSNTFCKTFIHSNLNVRTNYRFSLRHPYILFLEVILEFKSQSYKSPKKISGLFFNLIQFIKPLIQPAFYMLKMHMHFALSAYFELHFRQFYHGSILYGP